MGNNGKKMDERYVDKWWKNGQFQGPIGPKFWRCWGCKHWDKETTQDHQDSEDPFTWSQAKIHLSDEGVFICVFLKLQGP